MNPLATLHHALSEGLRAQPDQECLNYAAQTRNILLFLDQQITASANAQKAFTESMRRLLKKKSVKTIRSRGRR